MAETTPHTLTNEGKRIWRIERIRNGQYQTDLRVFSRSSGWFGEETRPVTCYAFTVIPVVRLSVIDRLCCAGLQNLRAQAAKHSTKVYRHL